MKIELESTDQVIRIVTDAGEVPGRIWRGRTARGVPVSAIITRIAVERTEDCSEFERELNEQSAPTEPARAFPMRLIL
jgi:hypothetical protein